MKCRNYQEIKIQEQVQRLAVGTIPRSMWVVLMDDLVDTCKPGDDVTIWYLSVSICNNKYLSLYLFMICHHFRHQLKTSLFHQTYGPLPS